MGLRKDYEPRTSGSNWRFAWWTCGRQGYRTGSVTQLKRLLQHFFLFRRQPGHGGAVVEVHEDQEKEKVWVKMGEPHRRTTVRLSAHQFFPFVGSRYVGSLVATHVRTVS